MPDAISQQERRLIDAAVRAGRVSQIPRGAYTEPAAGGWRGAAAGRILILPDGADGKPEPVILKSSRPRGPSVKTRERIRQIRALVAEGLYAPQIAKRMGIARENVYRIAKRYQIEIPHSPPNAGRHPGATEVTLKRVELIRGLADQGHTTPVIAARMGLTYTLTRNLIVRFKIPVAACSRRRPAA